MSILWTFNSPIFSESVIQVRLLSELTSGQREDQLNKVAYPLIGDNDDYQLKLKNDTSNLYKIHFPNAMGWTCISHEQASLEDGTGVVNLNCTDEVIYQYSVIEEEAILAIDAFDRRIVAKKDRKCSSENDMGGVVGNDDGEKDDEDIIIDLTLGQLQIYPLTGQSVYGEMYPKKNEGNMIAQVSFFHKQLYDIEGVNTVRLASVKWGALGDDDEGERSFDFKNADGVSWDDARLADPMIMSIPDGRSTEYTDQYSPRVYFIGHKVGKYLIHAYVKGERNEVEGLAIGEVNVIGAGIQKVWSLQSFNFAHYYYPEGTGAPKIRRVPEFLLVGPKEYNILQSEWEYWFKAEVKIDGYNYLEPEQELLFGLADLWYDELSSPISPISINSIRTSEVNPLVAVNDDVGQYWIKFGSIGEVRTQFLVMGFDSNENDKLDKEEIIAPDYVPVKLVGVNEYLVYATILEDAPNVGLLFGNPLASFHIALFVGNETW